MLILIGGEKGGTGKSCLTQNIAVLLQKVETNILIIDCDPQKTTSDWATLTPISGNSPLTVTRPCSIYLSASRREQNPVSLINLFKRFKSVIRQIFLNIKAHSLNYSSYFFAVNFR